MDGSTRSKRSITKTSRKSPVSRKSASAKSASAKSASAKSAKPAKPASRKSLGSQTSLVLDMFEITPSVTKIQGTMMSDIFAETKASHTYPDQQSVYFIQGNYIRMEWINNWLQRFNGPLWLMEFMYGQKLALPNGMKPEPDWTYDEHNHVWKSRFDDLERVAYWCSLRDRNTNIPMMIMTVEHYPALRRSRHMYVAKTLQRNVDVKNILLEFHSMVANVLDVDEIETNPVQHVRNLFLKDKRVHFTRDPHRGGNMMIRADEDFKNIWRNRKELN